MKNLDIIRKDNSEEIIALVCNKKKCYLDYDVPFNISSQFSKHFKIVLVDDLNDQLNLLKLK